MFYCTEEELRQQFSPNCLGHLRNHTHIQPEDSKRSLAIRNQTIFVPIKRRHSFTGGIHKRMQTVLDKSMEMRGEALLCSESVNVYFWGLQDSSMNELLSHTSFPLYSFSVLIPQWKTKTKTSVNTAEQSWKNIFTDFQLDAYNIPMGNNNPKVDSKGKKSLHHLL